MPPNAPGELGHLSARVGEMADRLGEVEQMERNFLMSVSHELRTPLTAIRGHVAALLEGVIEDPELRHSSLETVEAETQRLERLVGDILDLAKLDTNRFTVTTEEVDMAALVEQAYDRYRDEAQRRSIDYRQKLDARPVIVSDGDRVLQVVGNLLSNAFRATPDGGRITLELAQRNGTVHVAVEDTGPGIPAEARERLFRPFVSNVSGGTGLGLAIAKELSIALGGRIDLESERRRGLALRAAAACVGGLGALAELHDVRLRRARAPPRSGRAARSAPRQPSVSRSTSRARSSTRASRSASIVCSSLLEPADHVVREALHLGEPARDRRRLLAEAVAERFTDLFHEWRSYRPHRMEARELDYDLPQELIAQHPAAAARRVAAARLPPRDRRGVAPRVPRAARAWSTRSSS